MTFDVRYADHAVHKGERSLVKLNLQKIAMVDMPWRHFSECRVWEKFQKKIIIFDIAKFS